MPEQRKVFEHSIEGNVLILTPHGSMMEYRDADLRNAYNDAYRDLCSAEIQHLVVDFHTLDYFGSTFVGMLIRLARKVRGDGGQSILCHLSEQMHGMLKQLMLLENEKADCFWVAKETRQTALDSLR